MSSIVLKFGGTSVATRARWDTLAGIVAARRAEGHRVVVVCSAITGVTNQLEKLLPAALRGEHEPMLAELAAKHDALARDLGVDAVTEPLEELRRIATGVSLTGEATPRLTARVLAQGELWLTKLGAAFLGAAWIDARTVLVTEPAPTEHRRFLHASCPHHADPALVLPEVAVTQGFVARDPAGETVVLGRGGSDTSAALFAARLGAARLEIWSDVPGMFTADPRLVANARMLDRVDYDEAQELASMGAKVLHPRCLAPVRAHAIPLHLKSTLDPEAPGTVIARVPATAPAVRAVTARRGVTLVTMETMGMWQQVGFLADAFAVFKAHGLSVDLVATSETNVTCSLDAAANALDARVLDALVKDLGAHCRAATIGPCAVVSLVGARIRAALHRLGPALEAFESHPVHLVSLAASDLNVSFVVDEAQADPLVRRLHALYFEDGAAEAVAPAVPTDAWWVRRREELLRVPTPAYVYDTPTLREAARRLRGLASADHVWYAVKANPNADVLRVFAEEGLGFECVSAGELAHVREAVPGSPILFTPNFAPAGEYAAAFEAGAHVTVDNLWALEAWPELFRGRDVLLRVDPGHGRGHHAHVRTAGAASKFGIALEDLERARDACAKAGARVVGLHAHTGSGILDPGAWAGTAAQLAVALPLFPEARVLDVGGGLGVGDRPTDPGVDLAALDARLAAFRATHPGLQLWLEPGRWLVARAGVLLAGVTQLKEKAGRGFVGVDAGMNALVRPMLYGAWHEIVNLTRLGEPDALVADVVGPICESGDVLGAGRALPATREGDVLLVATAGAYGHAMASRYNLRLPPPEVLLA
ncbi:MAG: bifunctional aspartate kinase/diaminopimelate decarboxylase [Myxococcota bacterium]